MKEILYIVLLALLLSCSSDKKSNHTIEIKDGVTYVKNSSIPLNPSATLELRELFHIDADDSGKDSSQIVLEPFQFRIDNNGDLYVADSRSSNIKRFDSKGVFLNNISKMGTGPGENESFSNYFISSDTIYLVTHNKTIQRYGKDGSFFFSTQSGDKGMIAMNHTDMINDSTLIGYKFSFKKIGDHFYLYFTGSIFDTNLNDRLTFLKDSISGEEYRADPSKVMEHEFIVKYDGDNSVYLAYRDKNRFEISSYNLEGGKQSVISKSYRKQKYSEEELIKLTETIPDGNLEDTKLYYDYKYSLVELDCDKYGNLWVRVDKGFDIFNSEGVYIAHLDPKTIDINFSNNYNYTIRLLRDKILFYDNDSQEIKIYDYELKLER